MIPVSAAEAWIKAHGLTDPQAVNKGQCEEFAQAFLHLFPTGDLVGTDNFVEFGGPDWPGGHIWIMDQGRHYDSEALTGVDHWRDLPFFKRRLSQGR